MKPNPPLKLGRVVALAGILLALGASLAPSSGVAPRVCGDGQETHGKGGRSQPVMYVAGDGQETHGKGGRRMSA